MLIAVLMIYLGYLVGVQTWCYLICGIWIAFRLIRSVATIYKKIHEKSVPIVDCQTGMVAGKVLGI